MISHRETCGIRPLDQPAYVRNDRSRHQRRAVATRSIFDRGRGWWRSMAIEGVDFANERPNPAALVRAGKEFVVRYVSPNTPNNPRKQLTSAEVHAYRAAELSICVVWE